MADDFLTQEEIDALLGVKDKDPADPPGGKSVSPPPSNLELIMDFSLTLSVQLGKSSKNLKETRKIRPGAVVELDRFTTEPVDILINDRLIARGEVVIVGEYFGVKIKHIINPVERVRKLG